jgi:hypothetical protein
MQYNLISKTLMWKFEILFLIPFSNEKNYIIIIFYRWYKIFMAGYCAIRERNEEEYLKLPHKSFTDEVVLHYG